VSEFERRTGKAVTGASVWRHPTVRLTDIREPGLGLKDVRIRPAACGVCGSDVHFYETDNPADFLDLVQRLRTTESSSYTLRDTPTFTCISCSVERALGALDGVTMALSEPTRA